MSADRPVSGDSPRVVMGARVRLRYEIELPGGVVVDVADAADPLDFRIGDGALDPTLEQALLGRTCGAHRIEFEPGQAFGSPDPQAVQAVPLARFPSGLAPRVNQIVQFDLPTGDAIAGRVVRFEDDDVIVDFNHPLAGRAFTFACRIDAIEPAPQRPESAEENVRNKPSGLGTSGE